MAPKVVDKAEKMRALALASVEIFGEKGFERTRMEDVAKAAGVGKGTIYEYFRTKDELMDAAVGTLFEDMAGSLMPEISPDQSASKSLTQMLKSTIASVQSYVFAYRFLLEYMIHDSRREGSESLMAQILTGYRQWLSDLIRQGQATGEFRTELDAEAAAAAIAAWVDGAVFHWYTLPNTISMETMGELFIEMTLNGLRRCDGEREEAK